jgi:hypothetical protein
MRIHQLSGGKIPEDYWKFMAGFSGLVEVDGIRIVYESDGIRCYTKHTVCI